jgi:hypothetical protein
MVIPLESHTLLIPNGVSVSTLNVQLEGQQDPASNLQNLDVWDR